MQCDVWRTFNSIPASRRRVNDGNKRSMENFADQTLRRQRMPRPDSRMHALQHSSDTWAHGEKVNCGLDLGGSPAPGGSPRSRQRGHSPMPWARNPPSTGIVAPVTKLALSEARKIAAPLISSTCPNRFIGVREKMEAFLSG